MIILTQKEFEELKSNKTFEVGMYAIPDISKFYFYDGKSLYEVAGLVEQEL